MATMVKEKRKEKKKKKEKVSILETSEETPSLLSTEIIHNLNTSVLQSTSEHDINQSENSLINSANEKVINDDLSVESDIKIDKTKTTSNKTESQAVNDSKIIGNKEESELLEAGSKVIEAKSKVIEAENKLINNSLETNLAKLEIKTDNILTAGEFNETQNSSQNLEQFEAQATIKTESNVDIKLFNFKEAYSLLNETKEDYSLIDKSKVDNSLINKSKDDHRLKNESKDDYSLKNEAQDDFSLKNETEELNATPSAPIMYESPALVQQITTEEHTEESTVQIQSLPLEDVLRIFGEKEIMEVKAVSQMEEALVEAGPDCGAEHPLVDLLYTFRSSINKMNHESIELSKSITEEEKFRTALWTVHTKVYQISEKCPCKGRIYFKANYEEATFLKEKLALAKMKLKSIVNQVQESYCHYLHSALLAHCQIEDLLSYITQSNKREIRTALALVLQELRLSEDGGGVVCEALLRWSQALVAALLQNGDLRHLLFLVHHLFRQSRSISWAAKYIHIPVRDICEAAQGIAILEVLLTNVTVSDSKECVEDVSDQWEELDESGASGAVSDSGLRERDVISLLESCSIGDLVSTLARMRIQDSKPNEITWSGSTSPHDVLRSSCGVRALLALLHRAARAHHVSYVRLKETLVDVGVTAASCLFELYSHTRSSFPYQMRHMIANEIETVFASTFALWISSGTSLRELPFRMLSDRIAVTCSMEIRKGLHETNPSTINCLNIEMSGDVTCDIRVRLVTMLSTDRREHTALANSTLEFLFMLAATTKAQNCKDVCVSAARGCLSELLSVHPCLYSTAFVMVGDLCQDNGESILSLLSPDKWRPTPAEVHYVLTRYSEMCPKLIPALLLALDYTPHSGLTLETQICLAHYIATLTTTKPSEPPDWAWSVLRQLNVHLAWWAVGLVAPNPNEREGLLYDMIALLTSSWGHCLPLICEYGVGCLLRLVSAGRLKEAAHCLAPIMIVLTQSPESIAFTKQFSELFNAFLNTGPTLLQRALGRAAVSGPKILLNLMLQQLAHSERRMNIAADIMWQVWLYALWDIPAGRELIETCVCATGLIEPLVHFVKDRNTPLAALSPSTPSCTFASLFAEAEAPDGGARGRLLHALYLQVLANQLPHVDNALKSIGNKRGSDELVIHKTAAALLAAPLSHPLYLSLWCIFFRLYFEKSPMDPASQIMGPLFFRGIIKTRVLNQLKTKLQELATYHQSELTKIELGKTLPEKKTDIPKESIKPSINQGLFYFQPLKLTDLIGEDCSQSEEADQTIVGPKRDVTDKNKEEISKAKDRKRFHSLAMARAEEYLRWLDDDIAAVQRRMLLRLEYLQPITEKEILSALWQAEFERRISVVSPDDDVLTPRLTAASVPSKFINNPHTIDRLKKYTTRNNYRKQQIVLKPLNQNDVIGDKRKMKKCLEDNFQQILVCCKQWTNQLSRVTTTEKSLWPLVTCLYESHPFMPVMLTCSNHCSPRQYVIPVNKWRINERAQRGIESHRASSLQALTQLARPRPEMAVVMATLQSLARQVTDIETAMHFVNEIWRYSNLSMPHLITLSDIAEMLIQRFICNDCTLSAALLARWFTPDASMSPLRQSVAGALLAPLSARAWHTLYVTLLALPAPPHTHFTFLSKFGQSPLSSNLSPEERMSTLTALLGRVERLDNCLDTHQMLLELLCVHILQLTNGDTLRFVCTRAATVKSASVREALSPQIQKAIEKCVTSVGFDELGHLLRDLGTIYWDIRSSQQPSMNRRDSNSSQPVLKSGQSNPKPGHSDPKPDKGDPKPDQSYPKSGHRPSDVASQIRTIFAAFVSAAYAQQFAVERVAWYSWSALVDAWSPWVTPHEAAPLLLPTSAEDNVYMLRQFCDSVRDLANMCAGCESYIFQQLFEWTGQIILSNAWPKVSKENAVQLSLLLNEQLELNWNEHDWFDYMANINTLLKLLAVRESCVTSWLVTSLRARHVTSWLRHTPDDHVAVALHQLFYVFTALPLDQETLEQATQLPWYRLPTTALESCLRTFFGEKFSETVPYHNLPCFHLVLYASGLILEPIDTALDSLQSVWLRAAAVEKRATCVSLWCSAMNAPGASGLVATSTALLLSTVADLVSHIEESELVELLVRAMAMLYVSPTDAAAIPSWEQFLCTSRYPVTSLSLQALGMLTSLEHFARLAEVACKSLIWSPESPGWSEVVNRLSTSHWHEAAPFLSRRRLHLAYALSTLSPPPATVHAHTLPFDFVESEVILSVWICRLCRAALERSLKGTAAIAVPDDVTTAAIIDPGDVTAAAIAVADDDTITAWCQDRKTSLLRVLTMRGYSDQPSDRHRLLSRYAKLILNPDSEQAKRAFESSCTTVLGSNPAEISSLTNNPSLSQLVKLAVKLYPNHEKYFGYELEVSGDS